MTCGSAAAPTDAAVGFLQGGGELGARMRAMNWATTPLGPPQRWSPSVKVAVSLCLSSRFPIVLWIGPQLRILYNDAYIPFLGEAKHPVMLGKPGHAAWAEIWPAIGPMLAEVQAGRATWVEDFQMFFARRLPREEVYVTFSYSPIFAEDGNTVEGVFCVCTETTERVLGERRLYTLRSLGRRGSEQHDVEAACREASSALRDNPADIPFAAIYLVEEDGQRARRAAETRLPDDPGPFPEVHALLEVDGRPWPLVEAVRARRAVEVADVPVRVGRFASPLWPDVVSSARILPLGMQHQFAPAGFLVVGLSPRRPFDAHYRDFLDLVAEQIGAAIADARAFEDQRSQAEALVELDRAKTAFFANVSHEFRTPITLMLGPLERLLAKPATELSADGVFLARLAHRNGLRLLKLVNALLDFARFEAGRAQASYEATDLARLTAELVSNFQSVCDHAGLTLDIACAPLAEPVYVDHDMWEKIVLNLLSNAIKFTFVGRISVRLSVRAGYAELVVRDTGVGIPADELPRIFERFHRVAGRRSRSHEGSGIGLALVDELVRLHGGTIAVESEPGHGTAFTVSVPLGTDHLPADRVGLPLALSTTTINAEAFVQEALRWLPAENDTNLGQMEAEAHETTRRSAGARILLADDNADMRGYLTRLLTAQGWTVDSVADGVAALAAARSRRPDLVLSDVMMPGIGGLDLAEALRRQPEFADVPILLLSARAGEDAEVEGLETGADDYLIKPFSARELVARVKSHLLLARLRRDASDRVRASEARLQAAVDLVGLALYSWNPVANTLEWDDRLRAIWGLPPGAPVGIETFLAGVHPEDRARVEAAIAACTDPAGNGIYHLSYRVIGIRDGVERWVSTHGRTHFAGGRAVAFEGAALDITERKQTEERLRALQTELSNELAAMSRLHGFGMRLTAPAPLSALLDEVLSAVMELQQADFGGVQLCDEDTGALAVVANRGLGPRFIAYFNRAGLGDSSVGTPPMHDGARVVIEDVRTDPRYAEHRDLADEIGYRAVQATCLVDRPSGRIVGILSTYFRKPHRPSDRDLRLTDLYAAQAAEVIASRLVEQRLRESEERFRQFADYSADALWIADTASRRIEYLSPAHDRIWGIPPGAVKELGDWVETVHPDDQASALAALERVERGEVVVQEYRILRPNGTVRWIRDTSFPIANEQGRVVRIGGISQDITKYESSLVYIIGPDDAARRELKLLLQEGGFDCRPFASATAFLDVASALLPGCVVLDIRSAGASGLTMLTELKARRIPLPAIVIGASGEVETAVRAMKAGAAEFLQAPHAASALQTAVASALASLRDAGEQDEIVEVARIRIAEMTTRERQVLEGLLAGETNKMIARRLDLSPRTVEVHRAHLMERLGTRTLPELVLLAAAAGLRPPRAETPPVDR